MACGSGTYPKLSVPCSQNSGSLNRKLYLSICLLVLSKYGRIVYSVGRYLLCPRSAAQGPGSDQLLPLAAAERGLPLGAVLRHCLCQPQGAA